jgi:hypothetical protein
MKLFNFAGLRAKIAAFNKKKRFQRLVLAAEKRIAEKKKQDELYAQRYRKAKKALAEVVYPKKIITKWGDLNVTDRTLNKADVFAFGRPKIYKKIASSWDKMGLRSSYYLEKFDPKSASARKNLKQKALRIAEKGRQEMAPASKRVSKMSLEQISDELNSFPPTLLEGVPKHVLDAMKKTSSESRDVSGQLTQRKRVAQ